jgi:hypothetical protein
LARRTIAENTKNVESVKSSKREIKCTILMYLKSFPALPSCARTLCCTLSRACKTNNSQTTTNNSLARCVAHYPVLAKQTTTHKHIKNNPKPTAQTGCTPVATVDGFVVLALVLGRAHFSHSAVQHVSVSAAEKMVRDDM